MSFVHSDRVIHRPSFEAHCAALWDKSPLDPITAEEAAIITLYIACLIIGIWSMGERTLWTSLGLRLNDAERLVALWHRIFLTSQDLSDWMQVHSICSIQAHMSVDLPI